jgi:hypothetical protein
METTEEEDKAIAAFLNRLSDLCSGKSDICIHCQKQVNKLEQVGRCVYASPCGCRQYQGTVPERWKPKPKIHPYFQEQLDKGL